MRLSKENYIFQTTTRVFSIGGAAEPLSILAMFALLFMMRGAGSQSWFVLVALIALVCVHAIFWVVTQPTNRFWTKSVQLSELGAKFFSPEKEGQVKTKMDWKRLRDRWEYSHLARAVFSIMALITLTIAVARPS